MSQADHDATVDEDLLAGDVLPLPVVDHIYHCECIFLSFFLLNINTVFQETGAL